MGLEHYDDWMERMRAMPRILEPWRLIRNLRFWVGLHRLTAGRFSSPKVRSIGNQIAVVTAVLLASAVALATLAEHLIERNSVDPQQLSALTNTLGSANAQLFALVLTATLLLVQLTSRFG